MQIVFSQSCLGKVHFHIILLPYISSLQFSPSCVSDVQNSVHRHTSHSDLFSLKINECLGRTQKTQKLKSKRASQHAFLKLIIKQYALKFHVVCIKSVTMATHDVKYVMSDTMR